MFRKAADSGSRDAPFVYGMCLWEGKGVANDIQSTVRYFAMTVNQGHQEARKNGTKCLADVHRSIVAGAIKS